MTRQPEIIRQLRPGDRPQLLDLLGRLSEPTRLRRYGSPGALEGARAEAEAARLLAQRGPDLVLVAEARDEDAGALVGVVELRRYPDDPGRAEIGIVVRDDRQGQGVGTLLLRELCARAPALGVSQIHFLFLAQNAVLRHMLNRLGPVASSYAGDGMLEATLRLPARGPAAAGARARSRL